MAYPASGQFESCCEGIGKSSAPEVQDRRVTCDYCSRRISHRDIAKTYVFSKTSTPIYLCQWCVAYGQFTDKIEEDRGHRSKT